MEPANAGDKARFELEIWLNEPSFLIFPFALRFLRLLMEEALVEDTLPELVCFL